MQQEQCTEEDLCEFENKGMSDLWFLFRYVYSEQHELSDRGAWYGTPRKRNDSGRIFCRESSLQNMQVCRLWSCVRKNIRPRDIMTKEAILNALTVDMALGCSTNSMLHLPAIAHEIGMDFEIDFANRH